MLFRNVCQSCDFVETLIDTDNVGVVFENECSSLATLVGRESAIGHQGNNVWEQRMCRFCLLGLFGLCRFCLLGFFGLLEFFGREFFATQVDIKVSFSSVSKTHFNHRFDGVQREQPESAMLGAPALFASVWFVFAFFAFFLWDVNLEEPATTVCDVIQDNGTNVLFLGTSFVFAVEKIGLHEVNALFVARVVVAITALAFRQDYVTVIWFVERDAICLKHLWLLNKLALICGWKKGKLRFVEAIENRWWKAVARLLAQNE